LPDEVIFDLYRVADALFLPSREEGFGIPILEAGFAGIPIFCADIEPLRALAGDEAVYFSPDENPVQIASWVMEKLQADSAYRRRVRVRQNYTWQAIYSKQIAPLFEAG